MKPAWLVALLVVAPLATGPSAQEPDRQAIPPTPPIFKSGVEVVRFDVRAVDAEGRPVRDLKIEDLEIVEDGRSRPIVLFQHVAEPVGSYAEVARQTIGGEVSTNRGAPRGHLYVLVFDQSHITTGQEQRPRFAAEQFLRTRVRPGDRVALYALPGPGPQIPFTSNPSLVSAQLIQVRGSLDREATLGVGGMSLFEAYEINRGSAEAIQKVGARVLDSPVGDLPGRPANLTPASGTNPESIGLLERLVRDNARTVVDRSDAETRMFLSLFADVIRGLAGIEGRKSIILLSEGFYGDNVGRDVEVVASAAAQAYAVVYALDLNRRGIDVNAAAPAGGDSQREIQSRLEPLGSLAADTDGELLLDASSRIDRALSSVASRSLDYYVVGFEPPAEALIDRYRYRRVSIRSRRPGVAISARTGYSLRDPSLVRDRRRAIDMALAAPFPQQGLPVEFTTYVTRGTSPGAHRVVMALQAELPIRADDSQREADVVFVAKSARTGRVAASGTDVMPLPRQPAPGRSTAMGQFQVQFDAPPGEYVMRVVVREPGGATGSVDRRFEVRQFDGVDVTASDLVVGRRAGGLPVRPQAYSTDVLSGGLEIYARKAADLERVEVVATLVSAGGDALFRVPATLLDVTRDGLVVSRGARMELPLESVAPGTYVVRATIRAAGEVVTELEREVEILAGLAPPEVGPPFPRDIDPANVLNGDVARRVVATLRRQADSPSVSKAADLASARSWDAVASTLQNAEVSSMPARVLRGMALLGQRQFEKAAEELQAGFDLGAAAIPAQGRGAEPGGSGLTGQVAFLAGWAEAMAGSDTRAISAWRNAVRLEPALVPAYLALADAYVRQAQPALAVQVLRSGMAVLPKSAELQRRLSDIVRQ